MPTSNTHLQNVRYRHEAVVDLMLENPNMTQREIASHLGVGEAWLSTIVNSHAFKEYYELRREQHNAELSGHVIERDDRSLTEQTQDVAAKALKAMEGKLDREGPAMKMKELTDAATKTLSALGFGSAPGGNRGRDAPNVLIIGGITSEDLAAARERQRIARDITAESSEVNGEEETKGEIPFGPASATG